MHIDYQAANHREIELSTILTYIDELDTGTLNRSGFDGYRRDVYNTEISNERILEKKNELVDRLSKLTLEERKKLSLELQIWWRDYKEEEQRLKNLTEEQKQIDMEINNALSKLTTREKELLRKNSDKII